MPRTVVMKFGGTSVGSTERIGEVAKRVVRHQAQTGDRVVVVVSAMGGETDRLLELGRKVSGPNGGSRRELDHLLASGEQVSAALTAMALIREGTDSVSFLAPQMGLHTVEVCGQTLIDSIDTDKLSAALDANKVPVVAGFQGVDPSGNLTTLGRGGSDATAVAIAAALNADQCLILTDIDGVYTALPQICKHAQKLEQLTYEEMLELASGGAKILQTRSVHLARKFKVPLLVCSSFSDCAGTQIVEEYSGMEDSVVSGITCRTDEARLTLRNVPDKPGNVAKIFSKIADAGIVIDMIVQSQGVGGKANLSCTCPEDDAQAAYDTLVQIVNQEMPEATVEIDKDIAKLSIVGEGMRAHAGIAAQMFEVLGREGINIDMITTSEIKISVTFPQKYSELAVRTLHEFFVENRAG